MGFLPREYGTAAWRMVDVIIIIRNQSLCTEYIMEIYAIVLIYNVKGTTLDTIRIHPFARVSSPSRHPLF